MTTLNFNSNDELLNATVWGGGSFYTEGGLLKISAVTSEPDYIVWPNYSPDGDLIVPMIKDGTATSSMGVIFRAVDSDNFWNFTVTTAGLLRVYIYNNGGGVELHSETITITDNVLFRVSDDGETINFYCNDVLVHTRDSDTHAEGTMAGIRLESTGMFAESITFPSGAVATASTLNISTSNNLPASGSVQVYVHKVSDKSVFYQGLVPFTNGNASVELPIEDFPVSELVDWSIIDPVNELSASARQATE
jgi:hypothetical protein